MGRIPPQSKVAVIDAVVTAREDRIYFHAIHRDFHKDRVVEIDLATFTGLSSQSRQHLYEGRLRNEPLPGEGHEIGWFSERSLQLQNGILRAALPRRSISIIEVKWVP